MLRMSTETYTLRWKESNLETRRSKPDKIETARIQVVKSKGKPTMTNVLMSQTETFKSKKN